MSVHISFVGLFGSLGIHCRILGLKKGHSCSKPSVSLASLRLENVPSRVKGCQDEHPKP